MKLVDNETDKDFERISASELAKLGELFLGKDGIRRTAVVREADRATAEGDTYCWLEALIHTEDGTKPGTQVTTAYSVARRECSICGGEAEKCGHVPGRKYGEKLCFIELKDPVAVYGVDFVRTK